MLESLFGSSLAVNALLAGLAVVIMCGVLSVLVVVKRLGFVGQGVSHSAFGGVGAASVLAVFLPVTWTSGRIEMVQFAVIVGFCVASALGIAMVSRRRAVSEDTAIGLFLVGSMALGAILVHVSGVMAERGGRPPSVQSWESILFGSILLVSDTEVRVAAVFAVLVVGAAWVVRRPMVFWVFDEDSAPAFGVRPDAMRTMLMILLAVAVVVAMKLAGVVLATALLVLPGATALRLSSRFWMTIAISVTAGVVGLVGGLTMSLKFDWPTGPSVVAVLTVLFAGAEVAKLFERRASATTGVQPVKESST